MTAAEDALELLLPEADPHAIRRARSVTHFLRLLSDDAQSRRAHSVGIDLDRARSELERQNRRGLVRALLDLLRHHLTAVAGGRTFVGWGEAVRSVGESWHVVGEFRDEVPGVAAIPAPGEPALAVATRLIESLERIDTPAADLALWRARVARVASGVRAAEGLFRAELERALHPRAPACAEPGAVRVRLAHVVECLLDRGAVREARALLYEHPNLVAGDARLRQLLGWSKICLGDVAGARSLLGGVRPNQAVLPDALVELRERRPEWLAYLAGRRHEAALAEGLHAEPAAPTRADLGAAVLALFRLSPDGLAEPVRVDVAPAWRERVSAWLREREDACTRAGEMQQKLIVTAQIQIAHQASPAGISGALGKEATLALALAPILAADEEVAGWLHVECEHHLLPARARLARIAERFAPDVLAAALARGTGAPPNGSDLPARAIGEPFIEPGAETRIESVANEPAAALFRNALHELGIKTNQRRWWGFLVDGDRIETIADGGEGAGLQSGIAGGRRALKRARATRGTVVFDEPDRALSIEAEAGSGAVLAISAAGSCCALLAIESSRRRDFRESDLARYRTALERIALALRLSQFRRWHRESFGFDVWFDAVRPDFRRFAEDLLAAARSDAPVVITGPAGVGKQILVRWLHYESAVRSGALVVHGCDAPPVAGRLAERVQAARGGSLLLEDIERLDRGDQEDLLRLLESEDRAAPATREMRWWLTSRTSLDAAVAAGSLRADLAQRLDRIQLRVPALADRREDVLPLCACLAERFAGELGRRAPAFADGALELLWRQPWHGNVRQLESFLYKLVLLGANRPIEADDVLAIAQRFGLALEKRLASRRPRRSDLLAALRTTRRPPTGRINKTRAAAYLGWDPDTLVARLEEAGIREDALEDGEAWYTPVAEPTPPAE